MKFLDFAQKGGFNNLDGIFVKESNGFHIMLKEFPQGYIKVLGAVVFLKNNVTKEQLKQLREKVGTRKINYAYPKTSNVLVYLLDDLYGIVKEEKLQKVLNNLSLFTNALNEFGFSELDKCIFCESEKEEEQLSFGSYNGFYVPMHHSCKEEAKNKVQEAIKKDYALNKDKYPISFLLACVAGFITVILINVISMLLLNGTVYAMSYALIPIASYFAYRLGKAPRDKKMVILIIIASVLSTLIVDCVFYVLDAIAQDLTLGQYIKDYFGDLSKNTFFSLLFIAIGIWISWGLINKTSDKDLKKFD